MILPLPQKNTSIALVLLTALLVNFTFGAAHVAFHHDSEHGHHDSHGEHGDGQDRPTHTAKDHEQDMLQSRVRTLAEVDLEQVALPFLAFAPVDVQLPISWIEEIRCPRPPPAWMSLPESLRGPPSLS